MKKSLIILFLSLTTSLAFSQGKLMSWDFDSVNTADTLEGYYSYIDGSVGKGLLLDGFTTRVVRKSSEVKRVGKEFTIQASIALGNYPWNWCPIITTEGQINSGYRLMVGPLGQISMQVAISEQWIVCTTPTEVLPLREWCHITATYKENDCMEVYLNGKLLHSISVKGGMTFENGSNCVIGMIAIPDKPSNIHRSWGTVEQYFGLDGIVDEIVVYNAKLSKEQIVALSSNYSAKSPEIAPRRLPMVENPRQFGAYYTKLKYYPGWDNVWRVYDDPDIVVCFEETPIKLIFWRGIRYGASWVSENENWMSDQSVEAWDSGEKDTDGCFEHMQDRHCRFSHVRIIENTPARVVIHWRYAPVSSKNRTWKVDPKTEWECWVDEYYYVYPDGSAVRKVIWKTGTLGYPRQFQETLALLHPGQMVSDLMEVENAYVMDYDGKRGVQKFSDNPQERDEYNGYTIQRYNYKSEYKPYICFEPGNNMELRNSHINSYNLARGCNHFPVGQARCDGRTTLMSDRPSHCTSFPISYPIIHQERDNSYWCGLYGMNTMKMEDLLSFGRSWAYSPDLLSTSDVISFKGYDRSTRSYNFERVKKGNQMLSFEIEGTKSSPIINPAFYIKNWGDKEVTILLNGKPFKDFKQGIYRKIEGNDLVLFLNYKSVKQIKISIVNK